MNETTSFNSNIFSNTTKNICLCSVTSMVLIILFIISPLSNFFKTSFFMKLIVLIILFYTIYLNISQTNILRNFTNTMNSEDINSQLNINIICSYIFTIFLGLLIIFVIKSFL